MGAAVLITEFVNKMQEVCQCLAAAYRRLLVSMHSCCPDDAYTINSFSWTVQKNKIQLYRHQVVYVWNIAVGSACWLLVTVSLASFLWHVFNAVGLRKNW